MERIPVVVAILIKGNSFLMCQRPPSKIYPLHWEFPGGKVESGETPQAALRRELEEELALQVGECEPWFNEVASYSNGLTYDITYFVVHDLRNEPANLEFEQIKWVTLDLLDDLQHLSGNTRILRKLREEGIPLHGLRREA